MYEVGGCVRDEILGTPSKDIDFTVVLDEKFELYNTAEQGFRYMVANLESMGIKIIKDKEEVPIGAEFLTARGIAPKGDKRVDMLNRHIANYPGRALDFVLARRESGYSDGRRPDVVEVGTLEDDLARRDFTMNAIAKDENGEYIDPYNGIEDIRLGVIRAVGDPFERLNEDALRALRAIRFALTKNFVISDELEDALQSEAVLDSIVNKISDERKKDELNKMFFYDSVGAMEILMQYPVLTDAVFTGSVSLEATMKTKGRGK